MPISHPLITFCDIVVNKISCQFKLDLMLTNFIDSSMLRRYIFFLILDYSWHDLHGTNWSKYCNVLLHRMFCTDLLIGHMIEIDYCKLAQNQFYINMWFVIQNCIPMYIFVLPFHFNDDLNSITYNWRLRNVDCHHC